MRRNWFWGIFLVLAAGILVVSQLELFSLHIGFWTIVIAMFLVAGFVASLIHLAVSGMVFSLAFLAIIFARPLGIRLGAVDDFGSGFAANDRAVVNHQATLVSRVC
ncbi:hypothetical protein L3X07_08405 [Levilactobacillus brevis]|nr:hypothetical protein [Levilactobacillus brevis]